MPDGIPRKFARQLIAQADPRVIVKIATLLYSQQTEEERQAMATLVTNGVGFNKADAFPVAHALARFQRGLDTMSETGKEAVEALRARLMKYASQLVHLMETRKAAGEGTSPAAPLDLERSIELPYFYRTPNSIRCQLFVKAASGAVVRRAVIFPRKHVDSTEHADASMTVYAPLWWLRRKKLVDDNDQLIFVEKEAKRKLVCGSAVEQLSFHQMKLRGITIDG